MRNSAPHPAGFLTMPLKNSEAGRASVGITAKVIMKTLKLSGAFTRDNRQSYRVNSGCRASPVFF